MIGTQPVVYFANSTVAVLPFRHLIWLLKIESVFACLIIFGKFDQSLFPRKDIVSITLLLCALLEAASGYPALERNQYSYSENILLERRT